MSYSDAKRFRSHAKLSRRDLLKAGTAALALSGLPETALAAGQHEEYPPVRTVTRGPKHHWLGYYDKLQFDPTQRYLLGMEAGFEHRSPTPEDVIKIGMVDLEDGDRWTELDDTRAWCWQQGCMLQWRPGSTSEILWNDRQDGEFVCHILDVKTGKKRTLFLYHVAAGKIVVLGRLYNAPEYTGEWRVDLHPRRSPDGRLIVFESPHTGEGRQMHLIDVSEIVG